MSDQVEAIPQSVAEIIAGLKRFGVTDFEEILTVNVGPQTLQLKLTNIPTNDEIDALLAVEEYKGHAWVKRVKCELLSRAISYINGVHVHALTTEQRIMEDPTEAGLKRDLQVILRNLLLGWGQEVVEALWRVMMTHSQRIEDALFEQFPDNAIMTEVEKRFMERARAELEAQNDAIVRESLAELYDPVVDGEEEAIEDKA